jgi:hypothetical protein
MVCKCSLVERLDLLPMAVLLMIGGKLPAQRAKSAHFVGHLPPNSEEWRSVLTAVQDIDIRAIPPTRTHKGFVAYTDGACLNNPGGPAGWSALLWSALDSADGHVRKGAPCIECYGYIPLAPTTTNNRAEIAAVLAALSLAPPALPLTIYSDSEYVIKVAQGCKF